jgi:hypothetical protein
MSRLTVSTGAMCPLTGEECATDECALSMSDLDGEATRCAFWVIAMNLDAISKAERGMDGPYLTSPATSRTFDPEDPEAWEQCTGCTDGEREVEQFVSAFGHDSGVEAFLVARSDGAAATADVGGELGARGASGDAE